MIRLFASDLDGTLLNEFHQSDEVIFGAVNQINQKGAVFCVATGRHMHGNQLEILGFEKGSAYYVSMNGAIVMDQNHEVIMEKALDKDFVKTLLKTFPDFDFECFGKTHTFRRISRALHLQSFQNSDFWKKMNQHVQLERFTEDCLYSQSDEEILRHDIYKINCRVIDAENQRELNEFLDANKENGINAPFALDYYEITHPDVNKGNALAALAQRLKIEENEIAVYGDGCNDLEMLKRFKHSYATENACDEAKRAAAQTIGNCRDHAVVHHIMETLKNR